MNMNTLYRPEVSRRGRRLLGGILAIAALAGCSDSTDPVVVGANTTSAEVTGPRIMQATINFDGIDQDNPDRCQRNADGSLGDSRPCFLPLRLVAGPTSEQNPVLNRVVKLENGTVTAEWPFEPGTAPDGFHKDGDTVGVVCTHEVAEDTFAGIIVGPDQLNLSVAPDLALDMVDSQDPNSIVVYARAKWLFPVDGQDFSDLPGCADFLG